MFPETSDSKKSVTKHGQLSSIKANRAVIRFWITALFVLSGKSYVLLHVYAAYLRQK